MTKEIGEKMRWVFSDALKYTRQFSLGKLDSLGARIV